jgi:hypothetical protein
MGDADLKAVFKNLVRTVATRLSVHRFVQRGNVLHKSVGSNVALIDFQLSDKTTKDRVVFTVNLGILCVGLLDEAERSRKTSVMDAHLRQRLGFLLPEGTDKWWQIDSHTNTIALADEISTALEKYALPYLDQYLDSHALIALWESGKSPGLTAGQRARLLDRLRAAM